MAKKRVLLMYISTNSGHHRASLAIENALYELSDDVEVLNVNSFNYTNPILEKLVNKTYMSIIKRKPQVWGYLYDNPKIVKKSQKLRDSIHRYNSQKTRNLLENFKPQAVICTQAFPCGIIADYKKTCSQDVLLAGVLTDYAPHAYWIYDNVDYYFVPSEETKARLVSGGISNDKIKITGIPIDTKFKKIIDRTKTLDALSLARNEPVILIMGGSQGLGPIKEIVRFLDNSQITFQMLAVAGRNRKISNYLKKIAPRLKKKMIPMGYAGNIDELMAISSLIITKPGGITISEALAKGLPIIIVKPIPGQEQLNTDYLIAHQVAVKIDNLRDIGVIVTELLTNPSLLKNMHERSKAVSKPTSSIDIAQTILERIM